MKELARYVSYDPDRHGNDRWYYRRGTKRLRLNGRPGEKVFSQSYDLAHESYEQQSKVHHVYFLRIGSRVKIGTTTNVDERIAALMTGMPGKAALSYVTKGGRQLETALHRKFAADRVRGEWFRFSDAIKQWIRDDKALRKADPIANIVGTSGVSLSLGVLSHFKNGRKFLDNSGACQWL